MKKLFLMPILVTMAIMATSFAIAGDYCYDSDYGVYPTTSGYVDYKRNADTPIVRSWDSCGTSNNPTSWGLLEYYCDANKNLQSQDIDCHTTYNMNYNCIINSQLADDPIGSFCLDTSNYICVDTDRSNIYDAYTGINPYTPGKVMYYNPSSQYYRFSWTDKCVSSNVVQEAYCLSNYPLGVHQVACNGNDRCYDLGNGNGAYCVVCGNGVKEGPEGCDDGNSNNNDACKNDCTLNVCNDGVIYAGVEACDSNSQACTVGGYAGTQTCNAQCSGWNTCTTTQYCGNGVKEGPEGCDGGQVTCASIKGAGWTGNAPCKSGCSGYDASGCTAPASQCNDPDGGRIYTELGTTSNLTYSHPDYCITTNQANDQIMEYYCDGNRVASEGVYCPAGNLACTAGRCLPEFTTIGAGIALIGASAGYALIRRKRR